MWAHQMSDMLFDTFSRDSGKSSNQSHAHVDGHADAGVDLTSLGGSANMSGDFDSNSLSTFLNEHSSHAKSAASSTEMGIRKASSVSIGEVQSRTHTQTESEQHFESASREFSNPNKCHAITLPVLSDQQDPDSRLHARSDRPPCHPRPNRLHESDAQPGCTEHRRGAHFPRLARHRPAGPIQQFGHGGRNTGSGRRAWQHYFPGQPANPNRSA
jgi:hypothetical protein